MRVDLCPDGADRPHLRAHGLADERRRQEAPPQSVLRFEDVSLAFDEIIALNHVSFDQAAGETRVVLGSAGSGKTALLKTAIGLIKPDSGRVWLLGEEITARSEHDLFRLRSRVGVLFQEGGLFDSLTVAENVAYPLENQQVGKTVAPEEIERRVEDALRFVDWTTLSTNSPTS